MNILYLLWNFPLFTNKTIMRLKMKKNEWKYLQPTNLFSAELKAILPNISFTHWPNPLEDQNQVSWASSLDRELPQDAVSHLPM